MKRNWLLVLIVGVITIGGIASSCNNVPEEEPWASFASEVASEINVSESEVFEAFEQAFEDGADVPGDGLDKRLRRLTDEDVEQIISWYQERPEGIHLGGLHTIKYYGLEIGVLVSGSNAILDGLAREVAAILGMEPQQLTDTFHQVLRESIDEQHWQGLDGFVAEGYLTPDQADRYYQWYLLRPDTITPGRMRTAE